MAASVAQSPHPPWLPPQFSPHTAIMAGTPPTQHATFHPPRARTKMDMCAAFLDKLQTRRNLDLTPELVEGIEQHFRLLPSRYALDVNISSLDVLNHKRLLDSARADPSAVSFQVRPVDIISAAGNRAAMDRRPSFGNAESLSEVCRFEQVCVVCCNRSRFPEYLPKARVCLRQLMSCIALQTASYLRNSQALPRPAFGSSPNLQVGSKSWQDLFLSLMLLRNWSSVCLVSGLPTGSSSRG